MNEIEMKPQDFRSLLQQELVRRCRKNPRYSLRSFAKSLGISSAAMTEMINGKRTITKRSIEKLGLHLGLSIEEIQEFQAVPSNDQNSTNLESTYRQVTVDQYALISDWYHYAIIELIKVKEFRTDHAWIAQALNITKSEANIAIERLVRLGLLETDENGELKDNSSGFSTNISGNLTSSGSKQLQKQILEQSSEALMSLPIEVRNHTSMTMAINPKHIPEAIKKITKFRRELCEYLESQGDATEVYQLSLSIFPVTQISQQGRSNENN